MKFKVNCATSFQISVNIRHIYLHSKSKISNITPSILIFKYCFYILFKADLPLFYLKELLKKLFTNDTGFKR